MKAEDVSDDWIDVGVEAWQCAADDGVQIEVYMHAIIAAVAPLIAAAEREACAKICDARYMGDNNREDQEARRCAAAIRARSDAP